MTFKRLLMIGLLGTSVLLTACSPDIVTTYTYQPPSGFRAHQCINRCLQHKQRCELRCQKQHQQCQFVQGATNTISYAIAANHQSNPYYPGVYPVYMPANYCQGGDCGCGDTYRQCYVNCGGSYVVHKHCVAHCDNKS